MVSARLYKRTAAHSATAGFSAPRTRQLFGARRTSYNARLAKLRSPSDASTLAVRPVTASLVRLRASSRRSGVKQLEQKSDMDGLRVRSCSVLSRVSRLHQFKQNLAAQRLDVANSVPAKLVAAATHFTPTTPLWFQDPVTHVVKTAAAKEQDELAAIAEKEERYQLTAQYVESVTSFIPELMNHLLSKKIDNKVVNYQTAQQMVRNIY